jgi:HAD superfamily hydrolase (TIGR01509 family)
MRLKAILFDVDGTIAETEEAHRTAFNRAFAEAGRDWHWTVDDYRELLKVTGGKERIRHFAGTIGEAVSDSVIAEVHARKNEIYAELVEEGAAALRPGIDRLMREAWDKNVKTAIATTTSRTNLTALLDRHFGAGSLAFYAMVTGEDVARKKPDPEVYLLALSALNVAPNDCIAIEDSRNGVLAAVAAGIPVLATPSLYTMHERFDGAVGVRPSLDEPFPPIDIAALDKLVSASNPLAAAS